MFQSKQINGKKLQLLDLTDLKDLLPNLTLSNRLVLHKSIQNLAQFRHDLKSDTLHSLILSTNLKLKNLLMIINNFNNKKEFLRTTAHFLSTTYRKLINWLVRLPFTRLKQFELFRDELNAKMKQFTKFFRNRNRILMSNSVDEEIRNLVSHVLTLKFSIFIIVTTQAL